MNFLNTHSASSLTLAYPGLLFSHFSFNIDIYFFWILSR